MRRIVGPVLGLSLMAVAAPTFAQNSASTTQDGIDNLTRITQTGSNSIEVLQIGERQQATVRQTGDNVGTIDQINNPDGLPSNVVFLTQDNPAGTLGNVADIDQDMANGPNTTFVTQFGSNNFAQTLQTRELGFARIFIVQSNLSENGTALVTQTGGFLRAFGLAFVTQELGTDNFARVLQGDTTLAADPSNAGTIVDAVDFRADSRQFGSFLTSEIVQGGFNPQAFVTQIGTGAVSTVLQGTGPTLSQSLLATVTQDGSHTSRVTQNMRDNTATVDQSGGFGNDSQITQGGTFIYGVGDEATVTQRNGNENKSTVEQGDVAFGDSNNVATILQDGSDNMSSLIQTGKENVATVSQFGGDFSSVGQVGTNNTATVTQGAP